MKLRWAKTIILAGMLVSATAGAAQSFTLMTYNVENLFDTTHDAGKKDFTYLPLEEKRSNPEVYDYCRTIRVPPWREECFTLDWDEETLNKKIENLAKVIKNFDQNNMPDILVLQEVENMNALRMLNEKGGLNYPTLVLIEGEDSRGIDVAIMSKYPLKGPAKLHYIDTNRRVKTRGILEAKFDIDGKTVAIFANHWPSQANPDELRKLAAKKLMTASAKTRADIRLAAGDFNTLPSDMPHGLNETVLREQRRIYFHETNPAFSFLKFNEAEGSHWYRGTWHYLDRILIDSKAIDHGVETSFVLHAKDYMLKEKQYRYNGRTVTDTVPFRFDPVNKEGYSDHLPVGIRVNL